MKHIKQLFLSYIFLLNNFVLFGEITPEDIKSIDIRMLCYAFAMGSGELRSHLPTDIRNKISASIHEIIKSSDNSTIGGQYTTHSSSSGCEVYWNRDCANNLKFEGFGYNKDDCIDGVMPSIPPYPFSSEDGIEAIENKYHIEKTKQKNEACRNQISNNLVPFRGRAIHIPSILETFVAAIKNNVNFSFTVDPTPLDRLEVFRSRRNSNKPFYCDVEFKTQSYNSYPTYYERSYELSKDVIKRCKHSSVIDFRNAFEGYYHGNSNKEIEILMRYEFYQFPAFIQYIKTFPYYDSFILSLEHVITKNPDERHSLDSVQGFKCSSKFLIPGLGKTYSEFRKFVHREADEIRKKTRLAAEAAEYEKEQQEKQRIVEETQKRQSQIEGHYKKLSEELDQLSNNKKLFHEKESQLNLKKQKEQEEFESIQDIDQADDCSFLEKFSVMDGYKQQYTFKELEQLFSSCSTLDEYKNISSLGLEYLENAKQAFEDQSCQEFVKNKNRANAIAAYLRDTNKCFEQKYEISNSSIKMLEDVIQKEGSEYGPLFEEIVKDYSLYRGNYIQHYLNSELLSTINGTADLHQAYFTDPYISNFVRLINISTETARQHKLSAEYEQGFTLSDYAASILDVGKKYTQLIEDGIWVFYKPLEITTRGIVKGAELTVEYCTRWFTNPIEAASDYYLGLGKIALLGAKATILAIRNWPEFKNKCSAIYDYFFQKIKNDPEQATVDGIGMVSEFLFLGKFKNSLLTTAGALKPIADFTKIVKEEIKVAKTALSNAAKAGIEHPNVQKLLNPVSEITKETAKVLKVTAEKGIEKTKKILSSGKMIVNHSAIEAQKVLATFKKVPPINLKHAFLGEIGKDGRLKGFHHAKNYPERIVKIIKEPDENGVFKAIIRINGLEKKSSFFPSSWSRQKVLEKINEAYLNPIVIENNGIIGKTSEGILIKMWFDEQTDLFGNVKILTNSAYPFIKE